jgi:hypothetical protein
MPFQESDMSGPMRHPVPDEYGQGAAALQGRRHPALRSLVAPAALLGRESSQAAGESLYPLHKPEDRTTEPSMNAQPELNVEEMIRIRLQVMRREHRELDQAIQDLAASTVPDQLTLQRLKKQKLALKDQIVRLEDQLIPDIIA